MSVKLKESELQQLQSYLDRLEQNVHFWPRFRWAQLILSVLLIASSIYSFVMLQTFSEQSSLAGIGIEQSRISELVDKVVEFRMRTTRKELEMHFSAVLFGFFGGIMLLSTLVSWRGKVNEKAMLVCLRNIVASHAQSESTT
jgi:hypothetical protein